jgi:hypothetical protein
MRRVLNIVLVLASIFVIVTASPSRTVTNTETVKTQFRNGLHVALPEDMKNFPIELVPLP